MAQKVQTLFIDDIDGGEAQGTVHFSLDGSDYEIDLNETHSTELRTILNKYADYGRKVTIPGTTARRGQGRQRRKASGEPDTAEVRAWAQANGIKINERGRIPASVMDQYKNRTVISVPPQATEPEMSPAPAEPEAPAADEKPAKKTSRKSAPEAKFQEGEGDGISGTGK